MAMSGVSISSNAEARPQAESAWDQAVRQNSLEAYAEFAMTYPDSQYAKQAYAKLSNAGAAPVSAHAAAGIRHSDANSVSEPGFVSNLMMIV
jgi:hypothetical protein